MMNKLWILFAALLFSPVAVAADCYHAYGENGCIQLAGQFDTNVGPSLMDLMNQRAAQTQQMILRQQQIQLQQQQIQMQQQQMDTQQQELRSRKLEIIKSSLLKLPANERERAIKEIDSLSENQRAKLLEHLATSSESERIQGFRFVANISDQQREKLIEVLNQ